MFNIDKNDNIHITQCDNAEIDLRIFNKDNGTLVYKWPEQPSKALRDSEGKLILDEEGNPIWPNVEPKIEFRPCRHNMEEYINGRMILQVQDLGNEVLLEKYNDEFPNTIFLYPEDTESLEPNLYYFNITFINEDFEVQTIKTGLFEVLEK